MLKCAQLCSLSPTPKSKVGLGQLCGDEHREQRGGAFKGRGTRVSKQETRDYLSPALNSCRSLVDRSRRPKGCIQPGLSKYRGNCLGHLRNRQQVSVTAGGGDAQDEAGQAPKALRVFGICPRCVDLCRTDIIPSVLMKDWRGQAENQGLARKLY